MIDLFAFHIFPVNIWMDVCLSIKLSNFELREKFQFCCGGFCGYTQIWIIFLALSYWHLYRKHFFWPLLGIDGDTHNGLFLFFKLLRSFSTISFLLFDFLRRVQKYRQTWYFWNRACNKSITIDWFGQVERWRSKALRPFSPELLLT